MPIGFKIDRGYNITRFYHKIDSTNESTPVFFHIIGTEKIYCYRHGTSTNKDNNFLYRLDIAH